MGSSLELAGRTMTKCPGCGAEVADGSKTCAACGKDLSLGARTAAGSGQLAKDTGVVVGKIGRVGILGAKGFVSGVKKGLKGGEEPQKDSSESADTKH